MNPENSAGHGLIRSFFDLLLSPFGPSRNLGYLHRSFANRCPNSSPGSASEAGYAPPGQSSRSRNLPRHGGWPWAEAGPSRQGGTSPPALWGREGELCQSLEAGLPILETTVWFPHVPGASLAPSCSAFPTHCAGQLPACPTAITVFARLA